MIYVLFTIAAVLIFFVYMFFEARHVKITKTVISNARYNIKIVHLSDIHIKLMFIPFRQIYNIIKAQSPDLVLLTGDYVDSFNDLDKFYKFLEYFSTLDCSKYACLGNHDYKTFLNDKEGLISFREKIESYGIKLLENESELTIINNNKINIIGISDIRYKYDNIQKAFSSVNNDYPKILISHNPDIIFKLPENSVDYMFCGHFHGGQIWLPFNIEFRLLRSEKLCQIKIIKGFHFYRGINLYINRGLGNVLFPFRFLCRPEIAFIII